MVKNVFFRVFETKKPLEKFSAIAFLDTKLDTSPEPKKIPKCLIFTEIRALKGEILFFEKLFVFFFISCFHFNFWNSKKVGLTGHIKKVMH